jgi:hypothetical protein
VPVRLSATSSEHVLAGTLALLGWAAWLRTAVDERPLPRIVAVLALVLAVLGRVDCWPQLLALALWPLLAARDEARLPLVRRLLDLGFFVCCWVLLGVYAYVEIVVPSNHPGPDPDGVRSAANVLVAQLWTVASTPPHWITWVCVGAAGLGLLAAGLLRRWGVIAAAVLSWALVFIPLGRDLTHDGLTGARYFVLAIPLLAVLAAALAELLERALAPMQTRTRAALLALVALALLGVELRAVQPGWRYELAFQAEYRFLAAQLSARETEGCTLWFVPPRQPIAEPDLDCCLAPDRSPLRLVAPGLRFRALPSKREPDDAEGCQLYYLGSVCSVAPELAPQSSKTIARIHAQCERLHARVGTDAIASQALAPNSYSARFLGPPMVELRTRVP